MMELKDYFLRFSSKEELQQVMEQVQLNPNYTHEHALDVVGTLFNSDGVYDEEGNVITPPTPVSGYHANLRLLEGKLPSELEPYIVSPETPMRVWA